MQNILLGKSSLSRLLVLLEGFNRGLLHGLQVQEGQGAGEVLGCIGVVVGMGGVDDTCVLSPPPVREGALKWVPG